MTEPEAIEARRHHMDQFHEERARVNAACTRRTCTVAESVSMEALEHSYPQVKRLREECDRVRDAAGEVIADLEQHATDLAPLWAMRARRLDDAAAKLREAMKR